MIRRLASGYLVDVPDAGGKAEFLTCTWLVRVPSGNPEPDSPSDCYREIDCGARMRALPGWESTGAFICDHGHDFLGLEADLAREYEREMAERNQRRF